jgi:hypothetical protein
VDLLEIVETIALTGVTVVPIRALGTLADIVKWNARLSLYVTIRHRCNDVHHVLVEGDSLGYRLGCGTFITTITLA